MSLEGKKIVITGGTGFLGNQIFLKAQTHEVVGVGSSWDLTSEAAAEDLFYAEQPDIVIHCAAPMGGGNVEAAKRCEADLAGDILRMGLNVLHAANQIGTEKVVMIGSACAYPEAFQVDSDPLDLWKGLPHPSHAAYGLAKRMLEAMGRAYSEQHGLQVIHIIPTSMYGPGDKIQGNNHFIPATIVKVLEAQKTGKDTIEIWGSGSPTRDLLYVEDAAEAILLAAEHYEGKGPLNIGTGLENPVGHVMGLIRELTEWRGYFVCDTSKPDGQPRRSLDISLTKDLLGWEPKTDLRTGLLKTIEDIKGRVK